MINLKDVTIGYKGGTPLLLNQSCEIPDGTLTALIGRNGSGKSTFLRALCGSQPLLSGEIMLNGMNPARSTAAELASRLSIVTTGRVNARHMTARQLVEMGRAPLTGLFGRMHRKDYEAVEKALERVGLSEFADREISGLSDGEHQRLMIARALAQDTPIILLDEPTGFLDVPNRKAVTALLRDLAHNQGKTILYSTHELELAMQSADLILHISRPNLYLGTPREIEQSAAFIADFE